MQPFGPNRCGPKIGGLCPFWGRGAGSPPNTLWSGPRPTCMQSFMFHLDLSNRLATVHERYRQDRQTDRQTDRQRTDSIGRTVLQTVAHQRFALYYNNTLIIITSTDVDALPRPPPAVMQNLQRGFRCRLARLDTYRQIVSILSLIILFSPKSGNKSATVTKNAVGPIDQR